MMANPGVRAGTGRGGILLSQRQINLLSLNAPPLVYRMPLLHIQLKANVTQVELQQEIHAQHMRLRTVYAAFGGTANARNAGVLVDLGGDFLGNTREINACTQASATIGGHSYLSIPRAGTGNASGPADGGDSPTLPFCQDMNLGLDSLTVPRSFSVTVYNDDATKALATFSDAHVHQIDLYFEYATNDESHTV